MKKFHQLRTVLLFVTFLPFICSCGGSYQARSIDGNSAVLVNPRILKQGKDDQALYRYQNPNADFSKYKQVIIDPVLIAKDAELDADELANYEKLAHNAYIYLSEELRTQYQIVNTPRPGAMRIQMALVDADNSKPVRTLLSFSPIGIGLNLLKYTATGKQTAVGEITAEVKITDAQTGQLLAAALDRRVGGKRLRDAIDIWRNADEALQYWAKKIAFVLCKNSGKKGCISPDA